MPSQNLVTLHGISFLAETDDAVRILYGDGVLLDSLLPSLPYD